VTKYYIDCREVGLECDFRTIGETVEQVVELCADHGRAEHGLRGFGPELYARMRPHIHQFEETETAQEK
jgi:predicted small metal-binding protein